MKFKLRADISELVQTNFDKFRPSLSVIETDYADMGRYFKLEMQRLQKNLLLLSQTVATDCLYLVAAVQTALTVLTVCTGR